MEIYDEVAAHTLGDQPDEKIFFENDYIEVTKVIKDGKPVMVKGISHVSGDEVTYIMHPDTIVSLWGY